MTPANWRDFAAKPGKHKRHAKRWAQIMVRKSTITRRRLKHGRQQGRFQA